ncbi:MAG: NAD-dependent epimerase/dehydratase family protein [Gammaproteobacteria bacterium]|nr:NAD-dependent epimerase/dehydratase family protein [Gammaproteobacteria bacterium]MBT5217131.1 NAD-dependent epimerase/dehydratase family protein [Gammaproteobacteria bacterium]
MNIAILGAAYTGFAACRHFKNLGHNITVTTTKESRKQELETVSDKVIVMYGSDQKKMEELLENQDILILTVAGGMVERDGKTVMDPDLYRDSYVGTAESIVAACKSNKTLSRIIFTSSLNAYGDGNNESEITEETKANPLNPFQKVYIETEELLNNIQNPAIQSCIFRTGTIHGPGREWKNQLKQISGQKVPFDGQSDAMIIHRDDVIKAIELAINKKLNGLYNLFNEVKITKSEFFASVCDREKLDHVEWLNLSPGPKNVSNQKVKEAGLDFLDPDATLDAVDLLD